ncbi:isopalmitoylresorcinol synthase [Paraoerskovia marina]|uniref:Isopalmitoylresorcinol synthase n=1 Tax=Paraoerskovia marina TaxID=545619 RepID=A0A1H1MF94_9CELL|nr:3-oxoacyl-[acyl-carrier-protein] synthase III C-terminal domain-containing protein [Paraoerskovia marina]SDR85272.1 isopalmitoylresorcinol synthase [Paraoerskovia marina]
MSRVVSVAPTAPGPPHPQQRIAETIGPLVAPPGPRRALLDRLHAGSGVRTRHLTLPLEEYASLRSFAAANAAFVEQGLPLAAEACARALADAGLRPDDVDLLVFTTVTGVGAPSLDAALAERLGLRSDVVRFPSFGLGCAGGAAGLARTHDLLAGRPTGVALLVSVELCSLTIQHGDSSTANLVSSGLFGDGAAAVVMVGDDHPATGPAVVGTRSRLYPDTAHQLGWDVRDSGFGIVLSPGLPDLLRANLAEDVKVLLTEHGVDVPDVGTWVVHAGGPKILDAVRDSLGLEESALARSRASLAATGNLSSSSVLHVLAATMADGAPEPGGHAVVMAFGPGVTAELVLLEAGC